jgi:16S rRNA (guanine527-N7)-methyltransferase
MLASERRLLAREASRLGCSLDDDQMERLRSYVDILRTWNTRIRILGDRDPATLVRKHLPDCLALVSCLPIEGPLADIGTGAGLPGVVLACVKPNLECWLIEARRKRLSFLYEVKARVGLQRVHLVASRAEELAGRGEFAARASVVAARAVPVDDLIALGLPLLRTDGSILVMQSQKGSIDQFQRGVAAKNLRLSDVKEYRLIDGEPRRIVTLKFA